MHHRPAFGWRNREGVGEFMSISTRIEALLQIARQRKPGEQTLWALEPFSSSFWSLPCLAASAALVAVRSTAPAIMAAAASGLCCSSSLSWSFSAHLAPVPTTATPAASLKAASFLWNARNRAGEFDAPQTRPQKRPAGLVRLSCARGAAGKLTRDVKTDVLDRRHGHQRRHDGRGADARRPFGDLHRPARPAEEARPPATTALVQFEIDQPLTTLSRMIGQDSRPNRPGDARGSPSSTFAARIAELGIDCGSTGTQSLYLAGNALGPSRTARGSRGAQAGRHRRDLSDATSRWRKQFGIDRDAAILSHDNIALDPRKLTAGLLLKALERKARFLRAGRGDGDRGQSRRGCRRHQGTARPSPPASWCWPPATN